MIMPSLVQRAAGFKATYIHTVYALFSAMCRVFLVRMAHRVTLVILVKQVFQESLVFLEIPE